MLLGPVAAHPRLKVLLLPQRALMEEKREKGADSLWKVLGPSLPSPPAKAGPARGTGAL